MKKSVIALIVLIIVVGTGFAGCYWLFLQGDSNGTEQDPGPGSSYIPAPEPDGNNEADRMEQERQEQEQREAERLEQERLEQEQREAEERKAEIALRRANVLEESNLLFRGYFYEEAIALLNEDPELMNDEMQALEAEIVYEMDNLVRFEGDIKHIFFHSLILHPEFLFPDLNTPTGGYNSGFAYQSELFRLLPQLLERGYVLYNINEVFSKDENGIMRQNNIYLPSGKRPLILSFDDPTYHYGWGWRGGGPNNTGSFNRQARFRPGFAKRIVFDEYGELATEVVHPLPGENVNSFNRNIEGNEPVLTYDGDVYLVIDAFVREHPEFSFRGHKGVIAATGYMGIFGYDLPDLWDEETRQTVMDICNKFKENGWLFASHSYSHNRSGFWGPETRVRSIMWDIRRWREEIEPIVGETNLFIAPFGFLLRGEAMQVILDNGFDIYCTVDFAQTITVNNNHAVMGRIEIGGYTMAHRADILNRDFFDVSYVKDPHRPPVLP